MPRLTYVALAAALLLALVPELARARAAVDTAAEVVRELGPFAADASAPPTVEGASLYAWAALDTDSGRYALVVKRAGEAVERAPVPLGIQPYSVDVGTDSQDQPVVAYARCDDAGLACDIYRFNGSREFKLGRAVNTAADERAPSYHRGRLAFARTRGEPGRTRAGLYVVDGGRPRRLGVGGLIGVTSLELSRSGLFAQVLTRSGFRMQRLLRVATTGRDVPGHGFGYAAQLDRAKSGGANAAAMTKPSLSGAYVHYARTNSGSGQGNRIYRIRLSTGAREETRGNSRIQSASWLGRGRFLIAEVGRGGVCGRTTAPPTLETTQCRLYESRAVSWARSPTQAHRGLWGA